MIYVETQSQREWTNGSLSYEGEPSSSTVPIFEDEVDEHVRLVAGMHRLAGWTVTLNEETGVVVARKTLLRRTVERTVWFEARDPREDGR